MKAKFLTLAFAAAVPLAACNTAPTATENGADNFTAEEIESRAAYDTETAESILTCTSVGYTADRAMEPNHAGTFNEERLAWHQTKVSNCVNRMSGNLFQYSYQPEVRDTIAQQIHQAEITAFESGAEPVYPTTANVATLLKNSRR